MADSAETGSFTATGQSATFRPQVLLRNYPRSFNVSLWGTFVGTVLIERTFDGGTNWLPLTALGTGFSFTTAVSEVFEEPEAGVGYRLNCTAYTSGTINYRMSQ